MLVVFANWIARSRFSSKFYFASSWLSGTSESVPYSISLHFCNPLELSQFLWKNTYQIPKKNKIYFFIYSIPKPLMLSYSWKFLLLVCCFHEKAQCNYRCQLICWSNSKARRPDPKNHLFNSPDLGQSKLRLLLEGISMILSCQYYCFQKQTDMAPQS